LRNKASFPLYLRIPGWCKNASISINGKKSLIDLRPGAYGCIDRQWRNGDKVILRLPMKVTLRTWAKNKNSVSVNYGPLTFSLKINERFVKEDSRASAIGDSHWQPNADASKWPAYNIYAASPWNYGLDLTASGDVSDWKVVHKRWPADSFPFTPDNVPLYIKVKAKQIPNWTIDANGLCAVLPESPVSVKTKEEEVTLIPMGATRLRISSFPTVK
jgi:hypothetical protein